MKGESMAVHLKNTLPNQKIYLLLININKYSRGKGDKTRKLNLTFSFNKSIQDMGIGETNDRLAFQTNRVEKIQEL